MNLLLLLGSSALLPTTNSLIETLSENGSLTSLVFVHLYLCPIVIDGDIPDGVSSFTPRTHNQQGQDDLPMTFQDSLNQFKEGLNLVLGMTQIIFNPVGLNTLL